MIIITDSHVSDAYGNVDAFFEMLTALSETRDDIVFLGDIFELWVGLNRYEGVIHRDFIRWCKSQKARRAIGFIEGNHEFFVTQKHRDNFTWSSKLGHLDKVQSNLWVHGDLINRADKNYLRFRRLSKNWLTKALVYSLPRGPSFVEKLKAKLKTTNQDFRMGLPKEALNQFAEEQFAKGVRQIIVGHFHQDYKYENANGCILRVLPDWYSNQTIGHLSSDGIEVMPWGKYIGRVEDL